MIAHHKIRLPRQLYRIMLETIHGPDLIAFGTAQDVAAICGVSPSTVSRLARHLGFKSFKELKGLFREPSRQARLPTQE
jgi:DNA-binding MurR/RpiR family transcriptional regulator